MEGEAGAKKPESLGLRGWSMRRSRCYLIFGGVVLAPSRTILFCGKAGLSGATFVGRAGAVGLGASWGICFLT